MLRSSPTTGSMKDRGQLPPEGTVKQSHKTLLLWVLIATMFLAIWHFLDSNTKPATQVAFSDFIALTKAEKEQPHVE